MRYITLRGYSVEKALRTLSKNKKGNEIEGATEASVGRKFNLLLNKFTLTVFFPPFSPLPLKYPCAPLFSYFFSSFFVYSSLILEQHHEQHTMVSSSKSKKFYLQKVTKYFTKDIFPISYTENLSISRKSLGSLALICLNLYGNNFFLLRVKCFDTNIGM